jgi:hypothetical protein
MSQCNTLFFHPSIERLIFEHNRRVWLRFWIFESSSGCLPHFSGRLHAIALSGEKFKPWFCDGVERLSGAEAALRSHGARPALELENIPLPIPRKAIVDKINAVTITVQGNPYRKLHRTALI